MSIERPAELRAALAGLQIDRDRRPSTAHPRGPRSRRTIAIAMAVALLLAGTAWLGWAATRTQRIRVEVAYASRAGGSEGSGPVLTGAGYVVTSDRYISLGVRVPGRIEAYLVEDGERVEKGQPLVRLDARPFQAALAEARAGLAEARAQADLAAKELRRAGELRARDVASPAAYDVKKTQLDVARATADRLEARVAQLELDLDDTVLRAPTRGIVLEKLKEVSEIAVPGGFSGSGELIRIANTDELRAELDINESDLAKVQQDQPGEIAPDAYPDRRYATRVVKLYPQINRQKGTLKVEVRILQPDEWLRPDMSVRVNFLPREAATQEQLVRAPRRAIRVDSAGHFVWTVHDGRVARRSVDLGPTEDGDLVQVRAGLEGGEALVLGEMAGIGDASMVEVAN